MSGFSTFEVEQGAFSIKVTINEAFEFSQDYTVVSGAVVNRMMNGQAVKQTHWEKLATDISCSGVIPPALGELNFKDSYLMRCGAKRAISSTSSNITLPATRRSDAGYEPTGWGYIEEGGGIGFWTESPTVMAGDVATITPVAGATIYRAYYWPEFYVFSDPPAESADVHGGEWSWSLTAEEV